MFSLAGMFTYTLAYYLNWPLFAFYLQQGQFHFFAQAPEDGPPIFWYGWLATAVLVGVAAAFVFPPRWTARISPALLLFSILIFVFASLIYELRWFI